MADWLDDPELYKAPKAPKSGSSDWLDDPALYAAPEESFTDSIKRRYREQSAKGLGQIIAEIPGEAVAGGESLFRGIGSGLNTLGGTAALIGGMPIASGIDAITGGRGASNAIGDYVTDSFRNADSMIANDPRARDPEAQIASSLGAVIPDLAMAYMTGGESAAIKPLVQQSLRQGVAREAEQMIAQGARASIVPSIERGSQLGTQVIDAGGTVPEALGAFGTGAAANSLAYMVPGAASGRLPVRVAEGALVEPLAGRVQNDVENLALPDRLGIDQAYDTRAAFMDAFLGGGLSAGMGGQPQERLGNPEALRTPEDVLSAEIETALDEETFAQRPPAPLGAAIAPETPVASPGASLAPEVAPDADAAFRRPLEAIEAAPAPEAAPVTPEAAQPPQPAAERLYSDYNPEASQIVNRTDGDLSFPENRLTRRALDEAVAEPERGAETLLRNLAEQPDIRDEQRWLANKLAPLMSDLGVKLVAPDPALPYAGAYSNTNNAAWIRQADPETILHELFHGATSALITSKAARSNPTVARVVGELDDMLGHLQSGLGLGEIDTAGAHPEIQRLLNDKQGPLSNTKELVTYGMTNRPFQDFLKTLPPPPGRTTARNMWEYFKQAVTSLFGKVTPQQRSFLDALIESGGDLVDFAAANPKAARMAQSSEAARLSPAESLTPPERPSKPPAAPEATTSPPKPEKPPVGTKNAYVEGERERRVEKPVERDAARPDKTADQMAKDAIAENPDLPDEIIARVQAGNPSVTSIERLVLLNESTRLRNERENLERKLANPELSDVARAATQAKLDAVNESVFAMDTVTVTAGRDWGREGRAMQQMMRDDFTLAALERKESAREGRPLTTEERAELKKMAAKIAEQQSALEATQKRLADYESGAAVAATYKRLLEDMRRPAAKLDVAALKARADAAKAALRELAGTDAAVMVDAATMSPQQALLDIGAYHYADGGKTLADWTKRMEADVPEKYREGLADLFELSKAGAARPVIEPGALTTKNVYDLALSLVRSGVKGEDAVMKGVFDAVKADNPGLTERDVRRLFSDYGRQRFPTKDADKRRVAELKSLVKLGESIARLEEGLPAIKSTVKREAKSAELRERQAEYNRLRKSYEQRFPDPDADARYQQSRATSLARQLADIQARIAAGDYEKAVRIPKELNEANERALFERDKAREVFLRHQFESEMAKRAPLRKIFDTGRETLNLARAIMTSFDLSAVLRQGGFIALGNPIRAAKSFGPMLQAFKSEEAQHRVKTQIENRPSYNLMKKAGLELTDIGSGLSLSKMEEAFMSRWIEKIPKAVGGGFLRGSQRAFVTFLNKLRADSFDAMIASLARNGEKPSLAEVKAIASYINVATGRGKIGVKPETATGLNTIFFAPRLVASRFNLLFAQPLYGGTMRTRSLIAQEYARFLTGVGVVLALGALAHDPEDDDKPFIGTDPRSTDFLKMRFGKTYIDPMAGLAQVTTFLLREVTGESVTGKGDVVPLRAKYKLANLWRDEPNTDKPTFGGQNAYDVASRFVRTKLAPIPGAVVNLFAGEDVVGNQITPTQTVTSLVVPLSMQNVKDVMTEHGVPGGTAITMLELLGMGVQYRDPAQMKAPDYNAMSRTEKNSYGEYLKSATKLKQAKSELQEFANAIPPETSPADLRYQVEKKAEELGIDGVTVDTYSRHTTARDENGRLRRGVKRTTSGNVQLNTKNAYDLSGMSVAEKSVGKIDEAIEALDEDGLTNRALDEIYREYQASPLTNGDDEEASSADIEKAKKMLRWERKFKQDSFVGNRHEN